MNHQMDSDTGLSQTKNTSGLRELLSVYRAKSKTEREKGTYFELLIRDFLKHDPTYAPNFSEVWTYAEWATLQGVDKDADTIEIVSVDKRRLVVRMNAIDGVEKGQPMGRAAKKYLSDLIFEKSVEIEPFKLDKYGRTVATVWLGETDVNLELVKVGYAWVYRKYADPKVYPEYYTAEAEAMISRKGLWSLPNPISPWDWRHPPLMPLSLSRGNDDKCSKKRFCKQMVSCDEAKYYFTVCGIHTLDKDGNGQPCNHLCR